MSEPSTVGESPTVLASGSRVLALPGQVSAVALVLPADLSLDLWADIGAQLGHVTRAVRWWLGDWWHYGDHHYGERAAQALDGETFAYQTFANAAWVCGKIEPSRRRETLSFAHHAEVAALEPDEQDELLADAEAENWTRPQLRAAVRQRRGNTEKEPPETITVPVDVLRRAVATCDLPELEKYLPPATAEQLLVAVFNATEVPE